MIAAFRSITKPGASWWFYVHVVFASGGFLLTLAGVAVGCYFPADNALMVQHKIIGIVVTVVGGLQVMLPRDPPLAFSTMASCMYLFSFFRLVHYHLYSMVIRDYTSIQRIAAATLP